MLLFDSVSPLERIKLTGQLSKKVPELVSAKSEKQPLKVVRLSAEIAAILSTLGVSATPSQPVDANQVDTARHYPQEQRRTPGARQKDNDRAVALLNTLQAEGRKATDEEKAVLARFSGYGGGLTDPEGKEGSPYEYYTPPPIASGVWEIVKGMGFTGGKVLDPSAGSGVFAATRPASAVIDQVELSPLSGGVNALVNDGPTVSTRISPFEAVAAATPDESYDAVITNVPFGDNSLREFKGADPKYQGDSLEAYFILRSLDKLKPGGLAAFITPPRCVSGSDAKSKDLRFKASLKAEFMGAYRLPNKIFQDASNADTIVDVIVFRKHSVEAKAKIDELAQQDTAVLGEAKVLWDEFLKGKYFLGEGHKYMLGEFKAGDKTKIRDADRVISDQSTANIAKLLQKFPGSRINWELLNTTEVAPIVYRDGDTIYQDGRTLEYQAGKWVPRESTASEDQEVVQTGIDVQTPLAAVSAGVNWAQVGQYVSYMRNRSRTLDIPDWITSTHDCLMRMKEGERADWFLALAAGLATVDVVQRHAPSEPFNYAETYPKLTSAIVESARFGGKSNGVLTKALRDGLTALGVMYTRKNGFHPRWKGEGKADIDVAGLTPRQAYEKLKYEASDDFGYIAIDRLAETQGADFDPYSSDDWCVSPDGKSAIAAGDYFTGRYADVLSRLGDDLQAAGDPKVRDKILRQQSIAESRLLKPDPERITFNLFSPFVSVARKVEFLRENVDQRFAIEVDETGKPQIVINIPSAKNERERQLKRYAEHLRVGTLTTRTSQEEAAANPELEARRLAELRELVSSGNTRFNVWVKSNGDAFDEVKRTLLAPENLYFREEQDTSALTIDGMNPELSLHDYQRAEVRRQAKKFGGINGFDVGLGKTFTALASVQYAQSIGVKKKTIFVVPNAVLSNWRKEASRAYASIDDCLFVGLDVMADGSLKVSSGNYARDMATILENRHRKIFMTLEAFTSIPMRPETLDAYKAYIASVDPSFAEASEKKAEAIRKEGKREKLTSSGAKSSALPFFEDMNVDSLVIDEAHTAKNSKYLLDFQGAKYLSTAEPSSRGLDLQVKSWFVRSTSPRKDGVYALTATPITNSPLEIYGMLCLAVGEEEVNSRLMLNGGADAFMNAFSQITETEEPDIVGRMRAGRVFLGLQNVDMLRMALGQVANIQDANSVGNAITVPEEDPMKTAVELNPQSRAKLSKYQRVYQSARAIINEDQIDEESLKEALAFSQQTGEPIELLAHPFNLINKMSNLIMDEDLDNLVTRYNFNAGQKDAAEKAVAAFNAKKYTEKMSRPGWNTDPKNITQRVKKDKAGNETTEYTVVVEASIRDGSILIDTVAFDTQSKFLLIAEKLKLDLDCSVSPKVAAFLANFRKEQAMPKAKGIAKQIIFCDMLGMHNKLKLLLSKQCGVPTSKIAIINAKAVTDPAEMQDIQDGFNADGDENSYQVIIANKKAEVGINLQKGTQAIHHLTLGWTPDSLTQRNGRGVRQGNYLSKVTVYHYDANGTFDEYKRQLVGKKDDWISNVMSESGGNSVQISGGISEKDMHDLIVSSGNEAAMEKVREQIALRERQRQTQASREAQVQTLRVIQGQLDWMKKYKDATDWRDAKIAEYVELKNRADELQAKIDRSKVETIKARLTAMHADIQARVLSLESLLTGGSLDWSGKPDAGMGFYMNQNGREKGTPRSQGKVNPESALFAKYQSERANIERSLDTARAEYKTLASRPGAYTESTLGVFESGDGAVIGGVLLTKGMVGKHKSELWIATSPKELVNPATGKTMAAEAAVSGFEFFGPADADEEWLPIAHQCAALDEAKIQEFADTGFQIGDPRLYSSYSKEIAEMVKISPSGMFGNPRVIRLRAPYFAIPVDPELAKYGSKLLEKIIADQSEVLEWSTQTVGYSSQKVVRVKDIRDADDNQNSERGSMLVFRYCMAHKMKASMADLTALNASNSLQYFAKQFVPEFDRNFDDALSRAVSAAKSPNDVDTAIDVYVQNSFPMLSFSSDLVAADFLVGSQSKKVEKAKLSISAGGKPVMWLYEMAQTQVAYKIAQFIADKLRANVEAMIADGKSLIEGKQWHQFVLGQINNTGAEQIAGGYQVNKEIADIVLANYQGEKPAGLIVLNAESVPETILTQFTAFQLQSLRSAVSTMLIQEKMSGIDVASIVAKIEAISGVESVSVITVPVYRSAKYGNGSYTYKADVSIAVKTQRGSSTAGRVSNKERGLVGRHWDKDNGWMLTLENGEKDSYGKPVASVQDFINFLGAS